MKRKKTAENSRKMMKYLANSSVAFVLRRYLRSLTFFLRRHYIHQWAVERIGTKGLTSFLSLYFSLSLSSLLLRHLSAISSFPRFLLPPRFFSQQQQRQTNYLRSRISIVSGKCLLLKMIFRKFEIGMTLLGHEIRT